MSALWMGKVMLVCAQRPGNTGGQCEQFLGDGIVSQALGTLAGLRQRGRGQRRTCGCLAESAWRLRCSRSRMTPTCWSSLSEAHPSKLPGMSFQAVQSSQVCSQFQICSMLSIFSSLFPPEKEYFSGCVG